MSAPAAIVDGRPVAELPPSLYVPPAAMQVMLDRFEGPLDFLHYLIRRDNLDILDIPMAQLTEQYLKYVDEIVATQLELAGDYLLMSASLIEIKSKMLLPKPEAQGEEEVDDPRAELVRRLLEYARIRAAAVALAALPRMERDCWRGRIARPQRRMIKPRIYVDSLQLAMLDVKSRKTADSGLVMETETLTMREAMASMLVRLRQFGHSMLSGLLDRDSANRVAAGTFFTAALQLAKEQLVRIRQRDESDIEVVSRSDANS